MNKINEVFLVIGFFITSIILWLYVHLISSDIPVSVTKNQFIISLISLFLFGVLYSLYMKKSRRGAVGVPLLIPLSFWLLDMINATKYNHKGYSIAITITGFVITVFCVGLSIYQLAAYNKKV